MIEGMQSATCTPEAGSGSVTERDSKTMGQWEEERLGARARDLTTRELDEVLPRRTDLQPPPFLSRLGGRVRRRLRPWPTDSRAAELSRRAEHFRAGTPDD